MQAIELFFTSARGVYIPRDFAECIDRDFLRCDSGVIADLDGLLDWLANASPYNTEGYWDEWIKILVNCYIEHNGYTWRLWHDGDLWLYCEELMTDQEKLDFFGEV